MSFIQQFQNIDGKSPLSRRRALIGLSLLALAACSRFAPSTPVAAGNVAYYTCTMHPFVRSQDPNGRCPVCGMSLVAVLRSSGTTGLASGITEGSNGMAYIAPERLQEVGATTEIVTKRSWAGISRGSPIATRLTVPSGAVLPTGNKFIVFVDHGGGRVEPREIEVGSSTGEWYEVISGLKEGDRVFVSANFLIDAECRIQGVLKMWGDRS
jgi:hypothetical protein